MKFKKAVSVILMLAVVLSSFAAMGGFAVSASESDNLITNGGFDTDTQDWNVSGSNGTVVSTNENFKFDSALADGNVAKFQPKGDWLYQSVELEKGEYVLKFNAYATDKIFFGVYNNSNFSTDSIIKYTDYSAVNHLGNACDTVNYGHNDVPYAYYENGSANRKISYTFVLNESTTVYIAFKTYSAQTLYLDNVSLEKVKTELVNGDFKDGTTGWSVTPAGGATLTAETLTGSNVLAQGKAAKLVAAISTPAWMYQAIKLKAGTYTWEFTTDTKTTAQTASDYIVGVYNSSTFNNSSLIKGTVQYLPKGYSECKAFNYRPNTGDYQSGGNSNRYNKYTFVLENETVVYLALRSNATKDATLYADNMTLIKTETELVNGDFEDGTTGWNVTPAGGATLTAVDATTVSGLTWAKGKAAQLVINGGTTAWMYQKIKLAKGTYTWEFTTENLDESYKPIFGVYNSATFSDNNLIKGTVRSHAKNDKWNDVEYRSENGDYIGNGGAKRYNKYTFELTEETVVYLALRTNANNGATLYVDNMTLTLGLNNGDANYDGKVDICDMIRIKKMIANSGYNVGGDCNDDAKLDSTDLASLKKFLLFGVWTDNDATENSINLVD